MERKFSPPARCPQVPRTRSCDFTELDSPQWPNTASPFLLQTVTILVCRAFSTDSLAGYRTGLKPQGTDGWVVVPAAVRGEVVSEVTTATVARERNAGHRLAN
ncbi:hypothetical protein DPEC_G00036840 [Dallia pectoralis]|uniref:Uncharacterized protein n=1 Tax=Dallia pectoralis TaxID=75939 RepID=A0ACC2HDN0_DALPE|nr:hypothetical protein DPEC_G00036840 [Dallia pectoralis]